MKKERILKNSAVPFCLLVVILMSSWQSDDILKNIQEKFDAYQKKYPAVKIDLVFNQPLYSTGDTIFFSVWYHDEAFTAIRGNHILTAELYGADGNLSQRIHFKVSNGRGHNQIILKKDLPPGEYQLLAYSDWMKNFGKSWFCRKKIKIISLKQITPNTNPGTSLTFFPEGGNFIAGILNKVVVVGPSNAELIVQSQNVEITRVKTDSTGVGSFEIIPMPNQRYSVALPNTNNQWPLSQAISDGLTVRLKDQDSGSPIIKLEIAQNSSLVNANLYAIITSRGKIVLKQKIEWSADFIHTLQIPVQSSSRGLYQLFIFDAKEKILAQRIFFQDADQGMKVSVKAPLHAKQREKVGYKIEVLDRKGNFIESDLSVSILQDNLFRGYSLLSDFELSDLPAVAERFLNNHDPNLQSVNDFLITQRWERINWINILENRSPELAFPFKSTLKLSGRLVLKSTGEPAPDSTLIMGYLQTNLAGYEAYSKKGYFKIPFDYDFFGTDRIFCTTQYKSKNRDEEYTISVQVDSTEILDPHLFTETSAPSAYGKYIQAKRLVANSYSFFGNDQAGVLSKSQNRNAGFEDEFMGVDNTVVLSDYVVFNKMKDVIQEIIPFVQYRERGGQERVTMLFKFREKTIIYKDDPLYIVDGVMSRNTKSFLSIKPEDVISIKIINNPNKLSQLGKLGENGIIFVETKNPIVANALQQENHFSIEGLSNPIDYSVLDNHNTLPRHPDLRPTLYWNPQMIVNGGGEAETSFRTSDDIGKMKILVQGLTKDHQYFATEQVIDVEYNPIKK